MQNITPITFCINYSSENIFDDFDKFFNFLHSVSVIDPSDWFAMELLKRKAFYNEKEKYLVNNCKINTVSDKTPQQNKIADKLRT